MKGRSKNFIPYVWFLSCLPLTAVAASEELLVNSYLNDQANRRIEQIVPKGEYTIQVNAVLKKAEAEESIILPFSNTPISMSDVMSKGSGPSIESLLMRVHHMEIDLSVTKNVPTSVRALMQNTLNQQFGLKPARGDRLKIIDLPADFELPWINSSQDSKNRDRDEASKTEINMPSLQSVVMVSAAIAFAIVLLGIIISFVFSRHSDKISESLREAADQIQDSSPMSQSLGSSFNSTSPGRQGGHLRLHAHALDGARPLQDYLQRGGADRLHAHDRGSRDAQGDGRGR